MHITSTPDTLVIENRPWIVGLILGFFIFALLAFAVRSLTEGNFVSTFIALGGVGFLGFFVWAFVCRNQLILNGADGTVTHSRRTLFSYTRSRYELAHLDYAEVQSTDGTTYRMALHISGGMDAGVHPFVTAYDSTRGSHRSTDAVNDWLKVWRA